MAFKTTTAALLSTAALYLATVAPAWALQVHKLSPQGRVDSVRQVVLQTDQDAVRFGDPLAQAPASVSCTSARNAEGTGRWNSAREWVWQFARPVPGGERCQVQLEKSFKSPSNAVLAGASSYSFEVEGPRILRTWPQTYQPIDEEQVFVLRLNAPATRESLLQHSHCRSPEVGERIPLRWVEEEQARAILQGLDLAQRAAQEPGQWALVACNRRLTPGSDVQFIYGAGVQTPSGVANRQREVLDFSVRPAFTAEMSCERERANTGCLPVRPVRLSLSAPVDKALAAQVRLVGPNGSLQPTLQSEDSSVDTLEFAPPLQPETAYRLELPAQLVDDMGRTLSNAASFPLTIRTSDAPALAKFASDSFGVLERYAQGQDSEGAVLPLTVRHIEGLDKRDGSAQLRDLHLTQDADIIAWWNKLQRYRWGSVARSQAKQDVHGTLPAPLPAPASEDEPDLREVDEHSISARSISLLQGQSGVQQVLLPAPQEGDPRPFEVIGVPLPQPGFHVLELDSPRLGAALLDERMGAQRRMFVRTSALVTNLAVHAKLGKEGSAVWVTRLDNGQPVPGAQVRVLDCAASIHAQGQTNEQGVLLLPQIPREAPHCDNSPQSGDWFVSARQGEDMAFVWSDWQRGIEPWRFNLPTGWGQEPELVAHSVLDRSLVRAGETVSMKHFVRQQTLEGLAQPARWPSQARITHVGSGQEYHLPLQWQANAAGGQHALSTFTVPPGAKLGQYRIELLWQTQDGQDTAQDGGEDYASSLPSGQFRVEAFRLPMLQGSIQPADKAPLVQPQALPVTVNLQYLNGGSAKDQPVQVSALLRNHDVQFERWRNFSFAAPQDEQAQRPNDLQEEAATAEDSSLLADKLPITLDAQGQGRVQLPAVGQLQRPRQLLLEASFADPNGEIQTLRSSHTLWPAAVLPGIAVENWASVQRQLKLQAVAVDTQGRPQAGVALQVDAFLTTTTSTRKRLVGGFYSYDNQTQRTPLGKLCSGKSDSAGLLHCDVTLTQPGQVELVVSTKDKDGHSAQAADTVWVTGQGELWFGGQDHDRMDLLPENPSYAVGDTARLQVRMPFREATALVSVEREGLLHTEVVQLKGSNPVVQLPVQAGWGPNVYVSVLALRGRLYEVPWYSFFTWGYKAPRQWWNAYWHGSKEYVAPTAMVDLSKPSFRLGVAELKVQDPSQRLQVQVQADKERYQVRERAQVSIQVLRGDGQPAANAQVAVAAVDKALLELMPNTSWDLADGLWRRRDWNVATATAQMEVVGRRHYGRKAAAPGGGGGRSNTRELFDTLLLWQPQVQLDAQGRAQVQVPLNDSLTSFEIVAIADEGVDHFGSGSTTIATTQDLQLISGLPPVVREGDSFTAMFTLRNTTGQDMQVRLKAQAINLELPAQKVRVPAGDAATVQWQVQVPTALAQSHEGQLHWSVQASDSVSGSTDAIELSQRLLPAVPLSVQQATLQQIQGHLQLPVQWPQEAQPGKGGLLLTFSERLADPQEGVPGLREWWQRYPHTCLEQTTSRAVGLNDAHLWHEQMQRLPSYLDEDGLALYFPAQGGRAVQGSDSLTAHLLSVSHHMRQIDARFTLPEVEQDRMQQALIAFVTGKLQRQFWSPRADLAPRKLAAIAALALDGKATPSMLDSLDIDPSAWPTHSLLDWLTILQHLQVPEREQRQQQVWQLLRNRLSFQGTQVVFSTEEQDRWWWLMQGPEVNAARLLLATIGHSDWDNERARLVTGLLARQNHGHWGTTIANLWAGLALRQFSQRYEQDPVSGDTTALLNASTQTLRWAALHDKVSASKAAAAQAQNQPSRLLPTGSSALDAALAPNALFLPWGERKHGAQLSIQHRGSGQPWVSLQSLAAVARTQPLDAGYRLRKTVTALQGAKLDQLQRGDLVRVRLEVDASADMTWVALTDPIPAGASILGSGLGRDSVIATTGEQPEGSSISEPAFVERGQDSYRAYWSYLPQGSIRVEYTLRLNNPGQFALPPSRVEALYAPEMLGETPNTTWRIGSDEAPSTASAATADSATTE